MEPDASYEFTTSTPLDVRLTLGILRTGTRDPTTRLVPSGIVRATRTPEGPATVEIRASRPRDGSQRVVCRAWGAGAQWVIGRAPQWVSEDAEPLSIDGRHGALARAARRFWGMRMSRAPSVIEVLLSVVVQQRVVFREAEESWVRLAFRYGGRAPGPYKLFLPPDPARLAREPYYVFHPLGIEQRRADILRRVAREAERINGLSERSLDEARKVLLALPGIGPWTTENVLGTALGDADALPTGDFHLPNVVSWALAGEARANDERMVELLEPFRGQRYYVVRLLYASGAHAPRYGARMEPRTLTRRSLGKTRL